TSTSTTAPPAACTAATVIPASGGAFVDTTAGASSLAGSCGGTSGSPERVYQWTPNRSGLADISTCYRRMKFSTVLYVRRGSCANGLEAACNFDACHLTSTTRGARLSLAVTSGQTYFIVV